MAFWAAARGKRRSTLDTRISPAETMWDDDLPRYLEVGRSAADAIARVLGDRRPETILDLPCGHGRVARHLRDRYPEARLFVSDLDVAGAEFCAATFDATCLPSQPDFVTLDLGRAFDLIWVGSLITHLPEAQTRAFLGFLARHLSPAGVAVVTSHGPYVAGRLFLRAESIYGLTPEAERRVHADYMATGYGYGDYADAEGYGLSLIAKEWLDREAAAAGLDLFAYADHGWDGHQDVLGLRPRGAT